MGGEAREEKRSEGVGKVPAIADTIASDEGTNEAPGTRRCSDPGIRVEEPFVRVLVSVRCTDIGRPIAPDARSA